MARSSRGEDARFSFWKQGFDSPTGYKKRSEMIAFVVYGDFLNLLQPPETDDSTPIYNLFTKFTFLFTIQTTRPEKHQGRFAESI